MALLTFLHYNAFFRITQVVTFFPRNLAIAPIFANSFVKIKPYFIIFCGSYESSRFHD